MKKRRKARRVIVVRIRRDTEAKRQQAERYYDILSCIHEWSERRRLPFRSVMLEILEPWARRKKIRIAPKSAYAADGPEDR